MREWNFGSLDGRQLTLRFFCPQSMEVFSGGWFKFSWLKAFGPRNWLKAAIGFRAWECNWRCHQNSSHRCYCTTGNVCDGNIAVCGFRVNWFYSNYTGETPCWCDKAIEKLSDESETP